MIFYSKHAKQTSQSKNMSSVLSWDACFLERIALYPLYSFTKTESKIS
nr:MAG TPA: hypothetical protein [Caudoviricetes sp.]